MTHVLNKRRREEKPAHTHTHARTHTQQTYLRNVKVVRITEPHPGPHGRWQRSSRFEFWSYPGLICQKKIEMGLDSGWKKECQIISGTEQNIRQPKKCVFTQSIHSRVSLKWNGFEKRRHKLSLNSVRWFTEACFWCYTLSSGTLMGHHWLAWDTGWQLMRRSKACRALMKQMDLTWWCLPRDTTLQRWNEIRLQWDKMSRGDAVRGLNKHGGVCMTNDSLLCQQQ